MQTPIWICHDGTQIRLSEMSTEHIANVIRYLQTGDGDHGPMRRAECSGFTNAQWTTLLRGELQTRARRGLY